MKKKMHIFFMALFFIVLFICIFLWGYEYHSQKKQVVAAYSLSLNEKNRLKDGDILLRHGYGFVSDMIVKTLNDSTGISHCAILSKENNKWIVIHSVSSTLSAVDGIQSQNLDEFVNQSKKNSFVVIRYKRLNDSDRCKIGTRAKYYLQKKIPFDNAFNIHDTASFYCSELIWKIFKDEFQIDIFDSKLSSAKYDYLKFDIFLDTTNYQIVIDHRIKKD